MNIRKPDVLNHYLRHREVNNYLDYLGRRYEEFVTVYTIGKSFEGRPLKAIRIDLRKNENTENVRKNWILIEAGTHAREWITVSVALYCIRQLTEKNLRNRDVLKDASFLIIPLVNADGYEYSHDKNRSWRKNRRRLPNSSYVGTDCNRNYDFHWIDGTSKRSLSTYRGETPFSEPETCAVRNVMQRLNPQLKFCLSFHSYAQSLMYPWGYTKELPPNWKELHKVAESGREAIAGATRRNYRTGSISTLTRRTYSGSIADYAYGVEKVPYVIVMELPSNKYGFQPPLEKIEPISAESWIGIKAMCKKAIALSVDSETKAKIKPKLKKSTKHRISSAAHK